MSVSKHCQKEFWKSFEQLTGRRYRPLLRRWLDYQCVYVEDRGGYGLFRQHYHLCKECKYQHRCADQLGEIRELGAALRRWYRAEHASACAAERDAMKDFSAECFLAQKVALAHDEGELMGTLEDFWHYAKKRKRRGKHPSQDPFKIKLE